VEAEVVRLTDFGAFVELETGIEGLIHISELSDDRVEKTSDVIKKGDKVQAMIISIDKDAKKIALSKKAVGNAEDAAAMKSTKQEAPKATTLGDKFKGIKV
jgi:small subunit ribosomal protein S1